jgi:hypothetical protein
MSRIVIVILILLLEINSRVVSRILFQILLQARDGKIVLRYKLTLVCFILNLIVIIIIFYFRCYL